MFWKIHRKVTKNVHRAFGVETKGRKGSKKNSLAVQLMLSLSYYLLVEVLRENAVPWDACCVKQSEGGNDRKS